MSRSLPPQPPEDEPTPPPGHIRTTAPGPLVGFGVTALVVGWALRPVSLRLDLIEPTVSWLVIGLIFFMAAIMAGAAYLTHQANRNPERRLEPHQSVNRLVLGKACALVGAVLAGGYFGYALAHLGVTDSERATIQLWHSAVAGTAGICVMVASLLLERACRVRGGGA